jgi:hypothetical protein
VLSEAGYKEFITPIALNDGTVSRYAKGITVTESHGRRLLEHGGGIFGYLSECMYYPEDKLSIVVLINTAGPVGPSEIGRQISDWMLGKEEDKATEFTGDVAKFAGVFKGRGRGRDLEITIEVNDKQMVAKYGEGKPDTLKYVKDNTWKDGNASYIFSGADKMDELRMDQVYGYYILKRQN